MTKDYGGICDGMEEGERQGRREGAWRRRQQCKRWQQREGSNHIGMCALECACT